MASRYSGFGLVALMLSVPLPVPAQAEIAVMKVSATLGSTVYCCNSNNESNYPIPGLFGGSVSGTFTYDTAASPSVQNSLYTEFPFSSLDIQILDKDGALVYTINDGVNVNDLRVFPSGSGVILAFGQSAGLTNVPSDLRLTLSGTFSTGDNPPVPAELAAGAVTSAFLEIDGGPGGSWDIYVENAAVTVAPAPVAAATWGRIKALYGIR